MRCLLIGNYGVGNLGDEALREYFLRQFDIHWTVVTASPRRPDDVPRLPFGIRSFVMTPWWKTLRAFRESDAVVFGGGSLFTDAESVFACLLWWWHGFVARLFGKPVFLAFQGIGPFRTTLGRLCARNTIRAAAFVSVRDEASLRCARRWRQDVVFSFDPVLSFFTGMTGGPSGAPRLAVIPRMNSGDALRSTVQRVMERDRFVTVHILSLQPDASGEQAACRLLMRILPDAVIVPVRSMRELAEELAQCAALVTERYHGALAGLALGIPMTVVPQRAGDKLDMLASLQREGVTMEALRARLETGERELQKTINMLK